MRIYHTADIHLGRRRLDGRLPDEDFARAFEFIALSAIADKADAFLIAGDLFDRPQVEPPHLRQAAQILGRLREAGIPVVAIEGNHDRTFIHSESPTWVRYLADEDLLILLRPAFDASGTILKQWDPVARTGSWIDLGGVRFTGAGYLGAATPNKVRQILDALEEGPLHVLLLHAGPDYFVGEGGGFSREDLEALEKKICYLALGHIHRPMVHGGWACNPGSPENCDLREAACDHDRKERAVKRGYAVVEIDPSSPRAPRSIEVRSNPRRQILRLDLECSPFGNKTKNGAEAMIRAAIKLIKSAAPQPEAVVDLRLTGRLNLNRIAFDSSTTADRIREETGVFAVAIDPSGLNVEAGVTLPTDGAEEVSREQVERAAIRALVDENNLWGLDDSRRDFADLFYNLKEAVLAGTDAEALAEMLIQNRLADQIATAIADGRRMDGSCTMTAPDEISATAPRSE